MKFNLLQRNAGNPFVWIVLLLTGVSCQRDAEPQLSPAAPTQKVADLVARAYQEGTPEEYAAITEAYERLSFEELELFNQLKTEQDLARIKENAISAGGRVDQAQMAQVGKELQQVGDFRTALNKRALQAYGKPYNQLEAGLVNQLMDQVITQEHYSFSFEKPEASARVDQTNDCTTGYFPTTGIRVSSSTTNHNSWTSRRKVGDTDCDYEYSYRGSFLYFHPRDWYASKLCDHYNNQIARRYAFDHTRLLFGNRGVWLYINYPGLLNVDMR